MNNSKNEHFLSKAFFLVFKEPFYAILGFSLTFNLLALYYFIFFQSTTFAVFFASNSAFYDWSSVILTLLISALFGIAVSFLVWQRRERKKNNIGDAGNTFLASFFGAISIGCPVCGAVLASVLGIGGGLAAFPFQGLEIKVISLGLMAFAVVSSAKSISKRKDSVCEVKREEKLLSFKEKKLVLNINKKTLKPLKPALIGVILLLIVISLPTLADKLNLHFSFQPNSQANLLSKSSDFGQNKSDKKNYQADSSEIIKQINPAEGYVIDAVYGDIGPKILESGALDFEKMKTLYERAGQPLTDEQVKILTRGSNEKIKIRPENAYFLLNFLWAAGLANKNPILEEGPIMKYGGRKRIGNFASTGGWTLGKKPSAEIYSNYEIIPLTVKEQAILEDFAYNSYRPCCSNPTGFPDCNHGMAALALGEIMASQGASADEIFEAFKYVNAFWFPQTYFDVAKYFKAKEGKDWSQVDGRLVASKDYSTPQGALRVRNWLKSNNLVEQAPSRGGGCGV